MAEQRAGGRVLLSFDVEEFDLPLEFGRKIDEGEQMVVAGEGLERVLGVLQRCGVLATLFCTARFALARPDLVEAAVGAGHELASHGWEHGRFAEGDLWRSREALESRFGVKVAGFRPARFCPVRVEAVREAGYRYLSSVNPIWLPGRYNQWHRLRTIHEEGGLVQVPIGATPLVRLPLFWLAAKNYPEAFFRGLVGWTLRQDGYVNLFFHPWEFCELRAWGLPWWVRRRGVGLMGWLEKQLGWLAQRARFEPLGIFAECWQAERKR